MVGKTVAELVDLSNRTRWVEVEGGRVSDLRARASALTGIPAPLLRLACGARDLSDAAPLDVAQLAALPVRLLLRLEGGKGGFGAMLRSSGKQGVKTTDFDACRDLNGRRLRHVNAEARLREWEAGAAERERKKQELAASRKAPGPPPIERFDDDAYDDMLEAAREGARQSVADALASGLQAAAAGSGADSGAGSSAGSSSAPPEPAAGKRRRKGEDEGAGKEGKEAKVCASMDPLAQLMAEGGEGSSSEEEGGGGE